MQVTTLSFISARVTQPSFVHSVYVKYEIKSHRLEMFAICMHDSKIVDNQESFLSCEEVISGSSVHDQLLQRVSLAVETVEGRF